MPQIHIDKDTRDFIDRFRLFYRLPGHPTISREQMLKLLIEHGADALAAVPSHRRPEKGIICFEPAGKMNYPGVVAWPDPQEICDLVNRAGSRLVIVYGRPGSGVSTYLRKVMENMSPDVTVFDTPCGDAMNITSGMLAFEQGRSAIAALGSDDYEQALSSLKRYTSEAWLSSGERQSLIAQCQSGDVCMTISCN